MRERLRERERERMKERMKERDTDPRASDGPTCAENPQRKANQKWARVKAKFL